jgi:hypothetical protein
LVYELVFSVAVRACVKIFCRAMKRGPGVEGMGNDGGGDGEDVGEAALGGGMACITASLAFLTATRFEGSRRV